jgi:hypothetical protein
MFAGKGTQKRDVVIADGQQVKNICTRIFARHVPPIKMEGRIFSPS